MQKLVNTYGKTFHTWQVDRGDTLPLGIPLASTAVCANMHTSEDCTCSSCLAGISCNVALHSGQLTVLDGHQLSPP